MICDCVEQSHRLYLCCFHMQIGVDLAEWPHQVTRSIVIDGIEVIAIGLKSFGILVPDWLLRMSMICVSWRAWNNLPRLVMWEKFHSFTFGHSVFNIRHLSVCEFIGILPGLKWNVPFSLLEAVGELLFTVCRTTSLFAWWQVSVVSSQPCLWERDGSHCGQISRGQVFKLEFIYNCCRFEPTPAAVNHEEAKKNFSEPPEAECLTFQTLLVQYAFLGLKTANWTYRNILYVSLF